MTLAQARRRSAFVGMLRVAFTAGAAIAAGVMAGHLAANAISRSTGSIEKLSGDEVVTMVNARFTGRDAAGRAFVITADTAQRQRDNNETIVLANPHLVSEDGTEIDAPSGLYDQDAQTLALSEDVKLTDSKGYDFRSTSAKVFIEEGRIDGLDPLTGTGPLGDLTCDTYEIVEEGEKMRCRGNVQMTIFPGGREPSASEGQSGPANEELDAND
jgi:lipopolysaccharide export system protein LptC